MPALDVLAVLLGCGRSSRLYQQVREKKGVVHHVDAWTYSPGNPGLFGMSAIVDADKFTAARDAMLAEVEKMKTSPVSAGELGKAVKQFIAATLAVRKTMEGQAQNLGGNWLAANDLNFSERYLAASSASGPMTSCASRVNISRRKTAPFTRCCPMAPRPNCPSPSKKKTSTRSGNLNCRTACACS